MSTLQKFLQILWERLKEGLNLIIEFISNNSPVWGFLWVWGGDFLGLVLI